MPDPTLQLNDNHRRTLLAGVKYIDRLLAEALAELSPAGEDAIFAPTLPDATPVQRKVIADQAARLRRGLRAALDACAIPVSPPEIGALWNLRCTLVSIDIALEDFGPDHLRGYGAIDDATAARTTELRAQIRTVLTELLAYLESGLGGDLSARLTRLDQTRDEVRLLRELERIVTAHGLVELRGNLGRLLDRLERNWWTVAFVGRVSSGKSSLLNHLLATDVLPTGVTPITAVPIRIVSGTAATATVYFATEKSRRIPAGQLGEFASEERNPGNARHVTDILLELPAARLAGDMCFVDTPGLGSLATAGAAQTLAFLPRCDLGVLLLDAATTPGEEDIAVARALLEGGAEVLLVLSKADLHTPADCEKVLAYVRRQFADALGRKLPVAPVSVTPGHTALTEQWFAAELAPRQAHHRELAAATLRRKIGALREATVATLASRAGLAPTAPGPSAAGDAGALGTARAALESSRNALHDLAYKATPPGDAVCVAIAGALAASPADNQFPEAVAHELGRAAARLGAEFDALLRATRDTAAHAITNVTGESREGAALPAPFARPLFDPAPILATSRLSTAWRRWPVASLRRMALRRHLCAQLAGTLDDALQAYARTLIRWSERYLDELAAQFNAQAGFAEVRSAAPRARGEEVEAMRRDLELLRSWNARSAA
ncbi:MAG: dynamin family protein [Opitutaceae bacterium]|jgi:GTP-binding protein EngB required for normal cell division